MTAATNRFCRHAFVLLAILLASASDFVAAQGPRGLRLRDIVLAKLPPDAKIMGLDFTIVHVDDNGNRKLVDTAPEEYPFKVGDSFLVKIKAQDDLFVYVFSEGPEGTRRRLLPEQADQPLRVRKGDEVALPDGDLFKFQHPAGEEKLLVVALREHNQNLVLVEEAAFKQDAKKLQSGAKAVAPAASTTASPPDASASIPPVAADTPSQNVLAGLLSKLEDTRDAGWRRRGPPSMVKAAAADLGTLGDNSAQIDMTPTPESPTTQVVGVNTPQLVVGISLKSKPKAGGAR